MKLQTKEQRLAWQQGEIDSIEKRYPVGFSVQHVHDIVVVLYNSPIGGTLRPCVEIYKQGAARCFANNYFRTLESRDAFVTGAIESAKARCKSKETRKNKRREFRHCLKVGDILVNSWGYDQTNTDYFQVVATEEFYVTVREIANKSVPGSEGFMSERVQPAKDHFIGEPMRKKVCEGNCLKIHEWGSWAHLCNENAEHYHSWYA